MAIDIAYRLRGALAENTNLKLLSLAFALLFYSGVHGSQDGQRSLLLGVVALTPPESANRVLATPIPPEIRVTVRGPRQALDDVHPDDLSVQVDLRGGNEARLTFDPSLIPVPPGLRVEQIDPPAIDLTWEDRIARDVSVEAGIVGSPAPGFVVKGAASIDPAIVKARGPRSEVVVLQHARSDAFDVNGLGAGRFTRQLAIERPPGRVTYDAASVAVTVEIGRELVERLFSRLPVAVIGRVNSKSQPAEVDVRVVCPPEIARALRPDQIVPRAQITSNAERGSESAVLQLAMDPCEIHATPPTVVVRW